ncbi:MAG: enoyl-CoA hydratase/isomerase family protein [Burkholderiales bacterium]
MNLQTVRLEKAEHIATLILNRPERLNAMNRLMLDEINLVCDGVEGDAEIRVLIVTGAGSAFSSGFDLKEQMEARPAGVPQWRRVLEDDFNATMRFWSLSKPTIAAVQGHCLAGAFELAMACDITIAAENAIFGEPELKFGAGIVTMILPWLTGPKQAKEIILNGMDNVSAADALRLGLINRVVPNGEHLESALAMARHMAAIDPELMRDTKKAINRTYEQMGLNEALQTALDIDLQIESHGSPDKRQFMEVARREGLRAAFAWRDARFNNKR